MTWVATGWRGGSFSRSGKILGLGVLALGILTACGESGPQLGGGGGSEGLEIWWSEGYYPEETEAIRQAVNDWSEETGTPVELQFYSEKDLIQQSERAIAAGTPPDIIYGYSLDFSVLPQLAWQGKLADVTDVLEPVKTLYSPEALESVFYQNNEAGERSYYAVPISQQTIHIHYWQSLLAEVGLTAADIPQDWDSFWQFWATAQGDLRAKTGNEGLHGLGLPMSVAATDTTYTFEQFLEAYGVVLIDPQGNLLLEVPEVRAGIVAALTDYTQYYFSGDVPPNATEWGDPDNNVTFLSRLTLMTPNPTMSIPGSQRQDPVTYNEQMMTIPWPNTPSGEPLQYIASTKQVAIFADSPEMEAAKSFVAYLIQPEILAQYIEGAQGRFFPVMPELLQGSFWTDTTDPHTSVAAQQFTQTRPLPTVYNPAYSEVQAQNIWGQAVRSVVVQNVSPEDATDTAIAAIEQIFADW
ncbi:ABC transporter substrate-binding protein [Leptolyngbya sp. PCC 6406]|uniref:ABC transporter substrate-binding protein n=1 Tax=Leptolyngbya sp. PCC 6406 TaxID=1173264 RepID=UPI0002AC1577|nr:ABC transporter substrate-binding protein [Leptolyngbya sp. PCC 6406]